MAKNYQKMANEIVDLVGGKSNITSLTHCVTRLRFVLVDENKAQKTALEKVDGVIKVMQSSGQYQVVIGTDVGDVYDKVLAITGIQDNHAVTEDADKKSAMDAIVDTISGIFMPFMAGFSAAGLLKGILVLFTTLGILDTANTTYTFLYAMADGVFYFLPIFLAHTAGVKFGASPYVSMAIAAAIVYPEISALFNSGAAASMFGIPVTLISYTSSVIPIIIAVYFQSKLEKFLSPRFPKIIRGIFVPMISLFVTTSLTFYIIGPVTNTVSTAVANAIVWLLNLAPVVAGFVFALFYPLMIIFGLHWGFLPVSMNNFSVLGGDPIMAITTGTNFGMAGATLGIFLKTRNTDLRQISGSAFISAVVGGVTEPAIYGCVLKYKRPFFIVCLCSAVGGAILAANGAMLTAFLSTCVLTMPAFIAMMGVPYLIDIAIAFFGSCILTYLFGFNDDMIES